MAFEKLKRVTLPNISGLPRDSVVNDFAFVGAGSDLQQDADIEGFFNGVQASGNTIGFYLSQAISRGANLCRIDTYDLTVAGALAGGPLGSPVATSTFTMSADPNQNSMPAEVALCGSFAADTTGVAEHGPADAAIPTPDRAVDMGAPATHAGFDRLKARRRGRIFLGPFSTAAMATIVPGSGRPRPLLMGDLLSAMGTIRDDVNTTWGVWSRRDAVVRPVVSLWVDDAWDTIRRRGYSPSSRLVNP
jgi:hypothetical protein